MYASTQHTIEQPIRVWRVEGDPAIWFGSIGNISVSCDYAEVERLVADLTHAVERREGGSAGSGGMTSHEPHGLSIPACIFILGVIAGLALIAGRLL